MKMEYDKEIGNRKWVGSQELRRVMENKNVLLQDLTLNTGPEWRQLIQNFLCQECRPVVILKGDTTKSKNGNLKWVSGDQEIQRG